MSQIEKVELRIAYNWTCEKCGLDNFCRAVVVEMSEEDLQELRGVHGVESHETGDFVTRPDRVTCSACGSMYETKDPYGDINK